MLEYCSCCFKYYKDIIKHNRSKIHLNKIELLKWLKK